MHIEIDIPDDSPLAEKLRDKAGTPGQSATVAEFVTDMLWHQLVPPEDWPRDRESLRRLTGREDGT